MEKLSVEEKAKAYDEILVKAKELKEANPSDEGIQKWIEDAFPELKESEDEKIRKELKHYLEVRRCQTNDDEEYIGCNHFLAWLEKQGEIDKTSYEIAEKEKQEFVGDGFIKCYADFQDFKEGKTYWLEYVGNDNYSVRSDNLLGKTYHITPCQLYTIFKKLTWLEKISSQRGGKSALEAIKEEKVDNDINIKSEPKFKTGDWIIDAHDTVHQIANVVENVTSHTYDYGIVGGGYFGDSTNDVRHWKISIDVKDGNVLANDKTILLFKTYSPFCRFYAYCLYNKESDIFYAELLNDIPWDITDYHPATEEQRKLLFRKIYENGYFWDSKNMRLIKRKY